MCFDAVIRSYILWSSYVTDIFVGIEKRSSRQCLAKTTGP